jgi:hypothetical protein
MSSSMTVASMKSVLSGLGISTKGEKSEITERYNNAIGGTPTVPIPAAMPESPRFADITSFLRPAGSASRIVDDGSLPSTANDADPATSIVDDGPLPSTANDADPVTCIVDDGPLPSTANDADPSTCIADDGPLRSTANDDANPAISCEQVCKTANDDVRADRIAPDNSDDDGIYEALASTLFGDHQTEATHASVKSTAPPTVVAQVGTVAEPSETIEYSTLLGDASGSPHDDDEQTPTVVAQVGTIVEPSETIEYSQLLGDASGSPHDDEDTVETLEWIAEPAPVGTVDCGLPLDNASCASHADDTGSLIVTRSRVQPNVISIDDLSDASADNETAPAPPQPHIAHSADRVGVFHATCGLPLFVISCNSL